MKKILILGGGQAQLELIKTAKKMGLYTIVVGIEGNYPGYKFADKCYFVDIFDKEGVLKIAKEEEIDGISMVCSDFGLGTVGYINDALHLFGITEKSAKSSSNKYEMKRLLKTNGINTADFRIVRNEDDVNAVLKELRFPLIVKAVDLQGSRGIYVCKNPLEVLENYKKSIQESRQDYCIIEEFIQGEEFGAQAFVYRGKVLFVQPHGDNVWYSGKTNVPIGHYMPFSDDSIMNKVIHDMVCRSIKALGFDNCAVNVDFIMKDGVPYVIELTGRAGANYLPELTSTYLGLNYYEMVLKAAIGDSAEDYFNQRKKGEPCVMTRQLFSQKEGIVDSVEYETVPNIKQVVLFVGKGDEVHAFSDSRDCIGKILCVGKNVAECNHTISDFINNNFKLTLI